MQRGAALLRFRGRHDPLFLSLDTTRMARNARHPILSVAAVALVCLLASTAAASAHDHGAGSWINRGQLKDPLTKHYCCNQQDCRRIPEGGLKEEGGGYHIKETGEIWPYSRVLWESQDGSWWRCAYMQHSPYPFPGMAHRMFSTRCLIGPPPSF